jgi:hypothetical protein
MGDATQEPLLSGGAKSPSTAGDPVCRSHGARVLSWFWRFSREKKPPPSLTDVAPSPLSPESLATAAVGFAAEAEQCSAFVEEAKSFAEAVQAFADAEEPCAPASPTFLLRGHRRSSSRQTYALRYGCAYRHR